MLAGIDLGGTQVRVALARSDGNLITSVKTKTPLLKTPQGLVDWAAAEIERLRGNQKVTSIAIGAPGPIDLKRGVLVNPPNLPWKNVPLAAMLNRATGAKVHLANDADMAGLGEFHMELAEPGHVGVVREVHLGAGSAIEHCRQGHVLPRQVGRVDEDPALEVDRAGSADGNAGHLLVAAEALNLGGCPVHQALWRLEQRGLGLDAGDQVSVR